MAILNLTLKKYWFNLILSGEKKEEYREITPYWIQRLTWHEFHKVSPSAFYLAAKHGDLIYRSEHSALPAFAPLNCVFRKDFQRVNCTNGYGLHLPQLWFVPGPIRIGLPNPAWCPPGTDLEKFVFIIPIASTPASLRPIPKPKHNYN